MKDISIALVFLVMSFTAVACGGDAPVKWWQLTNKSGKAAR